MFNNYAIVQGVDQVVPVDVYAPGCPPGPETLIHAILTLHELIRPARSPAARRDGRRRRGDGRAGDGQAAPEHGPTPVDVCRSADAEPGRRPADAAADEATDERPRPSPSAARRPRSRWSRGQKVLHPSREQLIDLVADLRDDGYLMCLDVTAASTTSATSRRATCPPASSPSGSRWWSRCISHGERARIRLRVQVPERRSGRPVAVRRPPRHRGHGAGGVRHVRHHASTATPTSPASSCPRTGWAIRCARTTPSVASRCSSRAHRPGR